MLARPWILAVLVFFPTHIIAQPQLTDDLASALAASKTVEERTRLLAENQALITEELQQKLVEKGMSVSLQGDYEGALSLFELARGIAESLNYTVGIAASWNAIGSIQRQQSNFDQSMESFVKAESIALALKDEGLLSDTYYGIGRVHRVRGNILTALEFYQKSLEKAEKLNDLNRIARSLNSIGLVQYQRGVFEEASTALHKSLEIAESNADKTQIGNALVNLSNLYGDLGDLPRSTEYALKALEVMEQTGDIEGKAIILNNLGTMDWYSGNYVAALNLFQQSMDLYKSLGNLPGIARAYLNLSTVHGVQGNYEEARNNVFQGIELLKNQAESTHMAQAIQRLGDVYSDSGEQERALENYRKSLKMFRQIGADQEVADVMTSICRLEAPTSITTCEENVSISEKLGPSTLSRALVALASAYFTHQRFTEVIPLAERAAQLAKMTDSRDPLREALTLAGRAYMRLKNPAQAESNLAAAIHTIEDLRENIAGGELEAQRYFEKKLTAFHEMVHLLVRQKRFVEALEYAERAKGRVLYDVLRQRRTQISRSLSTDEKRKEQQFREKLQSANLRFRREKEVEVKDLKLLKALEMNVEKQRMQYERYRGLLYAAHPELRIQRAEFPREFWKSLTKSLPHQKAFLQYVVTEDATFLFLITAGEPISAYQIDLGSEEIARMAKEFRQQVADRDPVFRVSAKQLYTLLIKPAEKQLRGKSSLILIPDGQLWEVPFQTLIDGNDKYLIEKFPISYAHSLAVFSEMQKLKERKTSTTPAVLALGNPTFSGEVKAKVASAFVGQILEPLPEAEKEVKNLSGFYDSQRSIVLIQDQANEQMLKEKAGEFETLHFATHGMINNSSPMYSHLLLSPGKSQDGLLEAWEISEMDLKARLVVLSACNTARGRIGPGEGVIGLSWSLFIAGSPTALLSLWKVDSASTTELMIEFHENFTEKKLSPDVAAQQAALQLMKKSEYLHPFYWAGFVVVGNGI